MPHAIVPPSEPGREVVVGASLSGLFAAAATASAGRRVTVLERDETLAGAGPRPGVPQGRQPHVLLHRGLLAADELVPGLEQALEAAGAVRVDTGSFPWFGPLGWQPTWIPTYDVLSLTRPLLEQVVRERVLARPDVELVSGVRVHGLERDEDGWRVLGRRGGEEVAVAAGLVVDASGRSSRMPRWLADLGCTVREPEVLDAALGYACQLFRRPDGQPVRTGVVIAATPEVPRGALGLPVEGGGWLVSGGGYAEHRPSREGDLRDYLARLRDPALAEVTAGLEPVGDVAVHRQTGNRRHRYGQDRDWPDGLLVVGDALCAFNPVYGQGITVGACQALVLRNALRGRRAAGTRVLQRRLAAVAAVPWSVATTEDVRYLPGVSQGPVQRLLTAWTTELAELVRQGDRRAMQTLGGVYHLMVPPVRLFSPGLVAAVLRRRVSRRSTPAPRPPVLAELVVPAVR